MEHKEELRMQLFSKLHALAPLLSELTDKDWEMELPGCDGTFLYWPEKGMPEAMLLHELIHCLFCHPFTKPLPDRSITLGEASFVLPWDKACDLAAWEILRRWLPQLLPECLRDDFKALSFLIPADIFYRPRPLLDYLTDPAMLSYYSEMDKVKMAAAFKAVLSHMPEDSHEIWPVKRPFYSHQLSKATGDHGDSGSGGDSRKKQKTWEYLKRTLARKHEALSPEIMDLARRKKGGSNGTSSDRSGSMRISLGESKRHDYRSLLVSLAAWREEYRLNSNEFHYASYLYGLEHLDNVPMIEPLEYEETKKIYELAIVIDTSGSCSRGLTQAFLEETRNIMEEANLFFHPFRLHIIQCDHIVRDDTLITSKEDFQDYIEDLEVLGMGGTDFKPAFAHIEKLKRRGEFSLLQGILFFTDGIGLYPAVPPEERTIFLFLKDHYDDIDVPEWAETLVLGAGN